MTIDTTCLIIRPLVMQSNNQAQMHSIALVVKTNSVLQCHYLEQTFVHLHDIDHLLARVGYSTQEETETGYFMADQLNAQEWQQLRTELDPDDLEGQTGSDVLINFPELYRRAYHRYNISAWLDLFTPSGVYTATVTKAISLHNYELSVN